MFFVFRFGAFENCDDVVPFGLVACVLAEDALCRGPVAELAFPLEPAELTELLVLDLRWPAAHRSHDSSPICDEIVWVAHFGPAMGAQACGANGVGP